MPLDALTVNEEGIRGYLITRKEVAEECHISEDLLVEATMLMGNDYTKFVQDKKLRKSINFYRDHCEDHEKLTPADIFERVTELGYFRVESNDPEHQLSIDFSRALFQLQDVSQFLEDDDDDEQDIEDDENTNDADDDDAMNNYVKAFDLLLIQKSEEHENYFSLKSQVLAPFERIMCADADMATLLDDTFDVMGSQSLMYERLPSRLRWEDVQLAEIFQRSIQATLKSRARREEQPEAEHAPSRIFDHLCFYHALTARNKSIVEDEDGGESQLSPTATEFQHARKTLPIDEYKETILSSITDNRVTIIQGETVSFCDNVISTCCAIGTDLSDIQL